MNLGYKKFKFEEIKYLDSVKRKLLTKLQKLVGTKTVNFNNYHKFIHNEKKHEKIQWELAKYFRDKMLHIECLKGIENFLFRNFGQDILVQRKPFLRISRPFKLNDNIGLHKDTIYGQSPYEMSIHIPLTNLGKKSCLMFAGKSYLLKEKEIKFKKQKNLVSKGSKQHKLGKPYNNKEIKENLYKEKPVPIKYGEFVFFTPALVHGQILNKDENNTRFSFDLRVSSKFFPVKFDEKSHNGAYVLYSESPIEKLAKEYLNKQ